MAIAFMYLAGWVPSMLGHHGTFDAWLHTLYFGMSLPGSMVRSGRALGLLAGGAAGGPAGAAAAAAATNAATSTAANAVNSAAQTLDGPAAQSRSHPQEPGAVTVTDDQQDNYRRGRNTRAYPLPGRWSHVPVE